MPSSDSRLAIRFSPETGTLGRFLEDGASVVRIQGDDIRVRARVRTLDLDELAKAADDKARGVVLRRLRRALMEEA